MALCIVSFIIYFDKLHLWQCVMLLFLHVMYVAWVVVSEREHASMEEAEEKTALLVRYHGYCMLFFLPIETYLSSHVLGVVKKLLSIALRTLFVMIAHATTASIAIPLCDNLQPQQSPIKLKGVVKNSNTVAMNPAFDRRERDVEQAAVVAVAVQANCGPIWEEHDGSWSTTLFRARQTVFDTCVMPTFQT